MAGDMLLPPGSGVPSISFMARERYTLGYTYKQPLPVPKPNTDIYKA